MSASRLPEHRSAVQFENGSPSCILPTYQGCCSQSPVHARILYRHVGEIPVKLFLLSERSIAQVCGRNKFQDTSYLCSKCLSSRRHLGNLDRVCFYVACMRSRYCDMHCSARILRENSINSKEISSSFVISRYWHE